MFTTELLLLFLYLFIALTFSFLCSILEAVLLSVTPQFIALQQEQCSRFGLILAELKADINKPLTAILTLNTIAHTMGAAGVGAQVLNLYGNHYLTLSSAVLTLLILFFSEIIPKTIGTNYWRKLAKVTTYTAYYMSRLFWPVTWVSERLTRGFVQKNTLTGFRRDEFDAIAQLACEEGILLSTESLMLKNLLTLKDTSLDSIVTPRTVTFCLPGELTVLQYFHKYDKTPYSRILIYGENRDDILGFIMRDDLLLAQARGNGAKALSMYLRKIEVLLNKISILKAMNLMLKERVQIAMIVDEYGTFLGIITIEDIVEQLLGKEIVDEFDQIVDMQAFALKQKEKCD